MILTIKQYKKIMKKIDKFTPEELAKKFNITTQIAYSLRNQHIIKYVKRNHYRIKRHSRKLYRSWKRGKSLVRISKEKKFPPALITNFVLSEHGMKRKEIQKLLLNPEGSSNRRLAREIKEVIKNDSIYSPTHNDKRAEEGRKGEVRLEDYLDKRGIEYYAETDIRDNDFFPKTPDILFKEENQDINGHIVNWIESKSNFGSPIEYRVNYRKQLSKYTELYGPGIVVYWYGYVEGVNKDSSIIVTEKEFFED